VAVHQNGQQLPARWAGKEATLIIVGKEKGQVARKGACRGARHAGEVWELGCFCSRDEKGVRLQKETGSNSWKENSILSGKTTEGL